MEQLKHFTGPAWGRFVIYFALLAAGTGLAGLAAWGFGTYAEMPDGGWAYSFTITSAQLNAILTLMIAGGGSGVLAMLKGFKTRVGDIPAAERTGDKPLSSPQVPVTSPIVQ